MHLKYIRHDNHISQDKPKIGRSKKQLLIQTESPIPSWTRSLVGMTYLNSCVVALCPDTNEVYDFGASG